MTLGLLRGPYRGEIEITITRRFIGRIPLSGPNACPMVDSSAAAGAARTRALDSPSETERLREHQPPGLVQSDASAGLVVGRVQAEARPQGRGGEQSYEGSAPSGFVAKDEDKFAGEEAGEGGETDLGARGGGILMQALQRDPWADPPRDKEAPMVYPERWGSGDYSGWGRGGGGSIACNVVSGAAPGKGEAAGYRQDGDAFPAQGPANPRGAGRGEGVSQDGRDTGERWRQGHEHEQNAGGVSGALGPTTQPTNFSTSFPLDPASPANHLSHVTENVSTWKQGVRVEVKGPLVQLDSLAREMTGDRDRERDATNDNAEEPH